MRHRLWLGIAGLVLVVAGCVNYDSEFDSLVDEIWLAQNEGRLVDAVEYLEGKGWHYSPVDETVDRDHVIPLCRQIETEHGAECHGLLYNDDSAGEFTSEILVRLSGSSDRNGIRNALGAADAKFDGQISQTWGNKWMTFSFNGDQDE